MQLYFGIDPGLHGAVALITQQTDHSTSVEVWPTPTVEWTTGRVTPKGNAKMRTDYALAEMRALISRPIITARKHMNGRSPQIVVSIEKQQPMVNFRPNPNTGAMERTSQGVTSSFMTGRGFGLWEGLFCGLGLGYRSIPAQTWQRHLLSGITTGDTKKASIIAAQRLFPMVNLLLTPRSRVPSDGLADAVMIAEYGRLTTGRVEQTR